MYHLRVFVTLWLSNAKFKISNFRFHLSKLNVDNLVKSPKISFSVIPSRIGVRDDGQAGIQSFQAVEDHLDSGFHRSDDFLRMHQCYSKNGLRV
jgi:hypothetical protein